MTTPTLQHETSTRTAPGVDAAPLLELCDLTVSFDNPGGPRILAVDGASMSVYDGQTLAVVGESGCGKSLTALSVLGLAPMPPGRYDAGRILLRNAGGDAVDLRTLDERAMRGVRGGEIAMIFQEPMSSLNPVFTIGEQLREAIRLHQGVHGKNADRVAVEALSAVGITDAAGRLNAYPHEFSGGMRQRVMIAMALACRPRLLLADEPTTALDVTIQRQILALIDDLRRDRGLGVLFITHDLGVVSEHADVVCVMYAGRVVEYARTRDLFANPLHPYTRGLLACIPSLRHRRERLTTIAESVGVRPRFGTARAELADLDPWWPWDEAPAGTEHASGPASDSSLVPAGREHWVAAWRTPAARAIEHPRGAAPRIAPARA
jgi:ABC-type dipeptide/oligopeptide/nickel transport system ATPase component